MSELEEFRKQKDQSFKTHPQSPLLPNQKLSFEGLKYFPENPGMRIVGTLDENVEQTEIEMQTSTGGVQRYRREGVVTFTVDGKETAIHLYSVDDPNQFFVPFRDATSGQESYPAGRYLEAHRMGDGSVMVDFNYAYNPYCAYNERWSCPVPPAENWLDVPIRAGEMAWHD